MLVQDRFFGAPPPAGGNAAGRRLASRVTSSFRYEEQEGLRVSVIGRTLALGAIAVLLVFLTPFPEVLYFHMLLGLFMLLGLVNLWHSRRRGRQVWHAYAFAIADFALISFTLIYPNPLATDYPVQFQLRFGGFAYFHVILCVLAFSYQPRLVLIGGLAGAGFWLLGVAWIVAQPDTRIWISQYQPTDELLATLLDPTFVDLGVRGQEIAIFLIVASLLALIVARSRQMVMRQVRSERERGNLARYFPPNMVDRLARADGPLSRERELQVGVLFADVVGFTHWAEKRSPGDVIAHLRGVHARLEQSIFEHGGTLDKFIGDGVMATFGTPETGPNDAANTLRAAFAIIDSFAAWNRERIRAGAEPVRISVGAHFGPVITGEVGTERRLEFAVLGDTVNLASRLENLTRMHDCSTVVSDELVVAVRQESGDAGALLASLEDRGEVSVRGRDEPVRIWTHPATAA